VIAALRGEIIARGAGHVVVEVAGVGYKVFVPRLPSRDDVLLHTHQVVREDDQSLYGFETREELALFEMLISVSGVGPKAGLAILSVARPAEIAGAIASLRLALARRSGRFSEVIEQVNLLDASIADESTDQIAMGSELRGVALLNLGIVETWSGRLVEAEMASRRTAVPVTFAST